MTTTIDLAALTTWLLAIAALAAFWFGVVTLVTP